MKSVILPSFPSPISRFPQSEQHICLVINISRWHLGPSCGQVLGPHQAGPQLWLLCMAPVLTYIVLFPAYGKSWTEMCSERESCVPVNTHTLIPTSSHHSTQATVGKFPQGPAPGPCCPGLGLLGAQAALSSPSTASEGNTAVLTDRFLQCSSPL